MVYKVIFLLAFFGVASSWHLDKRKCDPERQSEKPTLCSNYRNIEHLYNSQKHTEEKQMMLEKRIEAIEGKTSNISALEILVENLSSALKDLEMMKSQSEMEFKDTKAQLAKHKSDIASLKREIRELVEHREIVGGNFSQIEDKLDTTERQLRAKKARLEKVETETKAAFSETKRLLNQYRNELSNLNTTAQELEGKVEARLDGTKMELEAKLEKIQNNSEAFGAKLKEQKAEVDEFKEETDSKFSNVDGQLREQKTTADKQKAEIGTLKSDTEGIKTRLGSTEKKADKQNELKLEVDRIKAEVSAKVAFSATITASPNVFTGPANTRNILIFNKVLTNIGNAYNSKTGLFTAPLNGVYHFSFMTFGYSCYTSGAILVKNGHHQVSTWEFKGPDTSDTTSNTVILELKAEETVNIILWWGGKIHSSVFTGFLIFPS
ncbi:filament-like plant protein 1 [Morone saxatilis]|uniref:filament-like plant protein 1 n=1 Tax=Morone saxatilis TaxID=34816 RepID=UPI0015E1EA51|nr:filament-like plant protein 1 [Morone saxatilis]